MERAIVEEDPKFASTLRGTSLRRSARRRAIAAGVVFVLGIGLLMGGVMSGKGALGFAIGIAGFVVMLGSATVALTAIRGQQQASAPIDPNTAQHPSRGFTVIDGGRAGRIRRPRRRHAPRRPPPRPYPPPPPHDAWLRSQRHVHGAHRRPLAPPPRKRRI